MNLRGLIYIILICFGISFCFGEEPSHDQKKCEIIMEEGRQALIEKDYTTAIKKLTQAEEIAEKENNQTSLWKIKNFLGQSYSELGVKSRAFSELSKSLDLLNKNPELEKNKPIILNNLASLFIEDKDFEESLFYLNEGIEIIAKYPDEESLAPIGYYLLINKAYLYNEFEKFDEALKVLEEIDDSALSEYPAIQNAWNLTKTQNFLSSGKIKEAKVNINEVLNKISKEDPYYDQALELLAEIYYQEKDYKQAVFYLNQSIFYTRDWTQKADRYDMMSNIYRDIGNRNQQVKYKDSVIISKDSLAYINNRGLLQTSKVQLDIEKYKTELAINKEKQKGQRKLFWIVVAGLLLLLGTTFFWQKNRIVKQKHEKIIIQNKEQLARLSLEKERKDLLLAQNQLKDKIALKNRKLATKALFLTERNQLIKEVLESINQIREISEDKRIQRFIQSFKNELKVKEEWDDYVQLFEEINPNFFKELKQRHPSLSSSDLRFLSYLYMNLTLQEIANVMVISLDACRKRKQRIAQKMNIETNEVLNYLIQIENGEIN